MILSADQASRNCWKGSRISRDNMPYSSKLPALLLLMLHKGISCKEIISHQAHHFYCFISEILMEASPCGFSATPWITLVEWFFWTNPMFSSLSGSWEILICYLHLNQLNHTVDQMIRDSRWMWLTKLRGSPLLQFDEKFLVWSGPYQVCFRGKARASVLSFVEALAMAMLVGQNLRFC